MMIDKRLINTVADSKKWIGVTVLWNWVVCVLNVGWASAHQNISRLFVGGLKPTLQRLQLLISTINGSHYRKQAGLNTENNKNSFYFLIFIKNQSLLL
ncbi:ABC transporter ATP-binding protein [Haemophilus influenzae]|nr:ABC transporter ATP-binding protein [Haemophilus influenzae]